MYRILLMVFLAISSNNTYAEWLLLTDKSSESAQKIFIESENNTALGNFPKAWLLVDFSTPQVDLGIVYKSEKIQLEIDCKGESIRTLSTVWLSENMGEGRVVRTFPTLPPSAWRYANHNSYQHQMLSEACKFRND